MSESPASPPAQGVRLAYEELPEHVRSWVDDEMGSPVTTATTQPGGFSPGVAARLSAADGSRAFVKCVSNLVNPDSPDMHRREAVITAAMPATAPVPRLRASYDDGCWVALLFDDVPGRHPANPWRPAELTRVIEAFDELMAQLTPAPVPQAIAGTVSSEHAGLFTNWRDQRAKPLPGLDGWATRHLDRLAEMEEQWPVAAAGDTLLHFDLRADNLLLTDDRVWFVDWPSAVTGRAVFDLIGLAPSVAMQGGPAPEHLLTMCRVGRTADAEAVTVLVAALAGYFCRSALLPPPPGLPTVRPFQAAQAEVTLRWLAERTRW